jgi:NTP pyrophosphatase (non-canonical NTP hydrolase)
MTIEGRKDYIKESLNTEELLCQLAEEAAELSQAALKLRRVITRINPAPIGAVQANTNLNEEVADVDLCLDLLGFRSDTYRDLAEQIKESKIRRWSWRLGMEREEPDAQ